MINESANLFVAAKKSLGDLLDLYQKRETALQCEEKDLLDAAKAKCAKMDEEKQNWEEEKKDIAQTYHFENNEIKLDIGGQCFTTTLTTLRRFPDTMIGAMFSGRHELKKNESGSYFIDRDGTHFRHILNFLRSPEKFLYFQLNSENNILKELEFEAEFYGLAHLMFSGSPATPVQEVQHDALDGCSDFFLYGNKTGDY
jgi:hypothetical protein